MNELNASVMAADSVRGGDFWEIRVPDAQHVPGIERVGIQTLFGSEARMTEGVAGPERSVVDLPQEAVLFGSATVLILLYCFLLRRYGYIVPMLFRSVFYKKSAMKLNNSLDVNISDMMKLGAFLFMFSTTVFIFTVVLHESAMLAGFPEAVRFFPVILLALLCICFYRFLFRNAVVLLTGSGTLFREIKFYNQISFTFWAILITPAVLLSCFVEQTLFRYTVYIAAFGYGILLVQRIVELYQLFNKEKVSFLQYILYFCTVEFLPVSFLAVYTYRKLLS